jgi:hypothetical protein
MGIPPFDRESTMPRRRLLPIRDHPGTDRMTTPRLLMGSLAAAAALAAGCHGRDEPEITGDPDGVPVTISVTYHEDAFASPALRPLFTRVMVRERRTVRDTAFYGGGVEVITYHHEWVERQPRVRALALGGDQAGDDRLWYWPLVPGTQSTTVPIRPGHQVVLTLKAEGGYRGETVIGTITPQATNSPQQVTVVLDGQGAHVSPVGVPGTPPAHP